MAKVTSIDGGEVPQTTEVLGEYMMVYFDEDGNITPVWSEGLTNDQLILGQKYLDQAVIMAAFWEDDEE